MPSNQQLAEAIKYFVLCCNKELGEIHANKILSFLSEPEELNRFKDIYNQGRFDESIESTLHTNPLAFSHHELSVLKKVLEYGLHRLKTCNHAGIKKAGIKIEDLQTLIKKI